MSEMNCYRATVELLIRAEAEGGACDLMSTLLTENGVFSSDEQCLIDWAYSYGPTEITVPPHEQGLDDYFGRPDEELATKGKVFKPGTETPAPAPVAAWITSDHSVFLNFQKAYEHEVIYQRRRDIAEFCGRHGLTGLYIEAEEIEEALLNHADELREILNGGPNP
jgi:hypothetical protein